MRLRILLGTAALVLGLALYALAVMLVAVKLVPEHWAVEAAFYLVAGIAWIVPAARLTRWMQAPDAAVTLPGRPTSPGSGGSASR
jgi:uncharacterized membrane protein